MKDDEATDERPSVTMDRMKFYALLIGLGLVSGTGGNAIVDGARSLSGTAPPLSEAQIRVIAQSARPDPFTGSQAKALQEALKNYICTELRLLRAEMPPEQTRERVVALESFARALESSYRPPSVSWGTMGRPCRDH